MEFDALSTVRLTRVEHVRFAVLQPEQDEKNLVAAKFGTRVTASLNRSPVLACTSKRTAEASAFVRQSHCGVNQFFSMTDCMSAPPYLFFTPP